MRKTAFVLLFALVWGISFSQPSLWSKHVHKSAQGDSLLYRMLYPDYNPGRKLPLVIFLHGSGERGNDNEAQLKWGVQQFATDENLKHFPAFVIAPQCPPESEWANFSERNPNEIRLLDKPTRTMELLKNLIDTLTRNLPVDKSRIYITGLSMGGFGTFDALSRYPDLFAAAVPVCGGGDISKLSAFKHIPIWIFAGAEDVSVRPELSLEMARALQRAGAHPGFTQYPETGHFSWIMAYSDPLMLQWLFRQRKIQ